MNTAFRRRSLLMMLPGWKANFSVLTTKGLLTYLSTIQSYSQYQVWQSYQLEAQVALFSERKPPVTELKKLGGLQSLAGRRVGKSVLLTVWKTDMSNPYSLY